MANIKITALSALTPAATDVLPVVDVSADITKKATVEDISKNAGNGSAAVPSHSFASDSDTGLFRAGINQLGISTNGTERARISSNGDIFIGGTIPSDPAITMTGTSGIVKTGSFNATSTTNDAATLQKGVVKIQRAAGGSATLSLFECWSGNTNVTKITANGDATFGGNVEVGTFGSTLSDVSGVRVSTAGLINAQRTAATSATATLYAGFRGTDRTFFVATNGSVKIGGTTGNSTSPKILLNGGVGSAQFAGPVSIGGTAANNEISDYEFGFWTPSFTLRSPTGTPTLTTTRISANSNTYVKVGKLVTVFVNINASTVTGIGATSGTANTIFIGTLPFSAAASMSGLTLGYVANFANALETDFTICGAASGTTIVLYQQSKATNSKAFLTSEFLVTGTGLSSTTNRLSGSISYYTNE